MRHDRVIDAFGGNAPLAKLVGRSDSAVSRWRNNGIPPVFWVRIVHLSRVYASEAVTIEALTADMPHPVPAVASRPLSRD